MFFKSKKEKEVPSENSKEVGNAALEVIKSQTEGVPYNRNTQQLDIKTVTSNPISLSEVAEELSEAEKYKVLRRYELDHLEDMTDLPLTATYMLEQIQNLTVEESIEILREAIPVHEDDINFPHGLVDRYKQIIAACEYSTTNELKKALSSGTLGKDNVKVDVEEKTHFNSELNETNLDDLEDWKFEARVEAALVAFWSPYPEVRAITEPFDDPSELCETFRAYVVSIVWQGIGTFINTYFEARQPNVSLSAEVVQVFIYPCGMFWARVMPDWSFKVTNSYTFRLNPGPWTAKEQMFATLIYIVAGGYSFMYHAIVVQRSTEFIYSPWATWGYEFLLGIGVNCIGLGLAGLLRCFFVYPYEQIWPFIIPTKAVNTALMSSKKKENINGWRISQYRFFFICFVLSFLYYWFPNYIFQALSSFSWITWIKPNSVTLDNICGFNGGIGLNPIPTLDFNVMWANVQPLVYPAYNTLQTYVGAVILAFGSLGMYYSNYSWTGYIPITSNSLYDNTGNTYNVSRILNSDSSFNATALANYSLPFYGSWNYFSVAASYATLPFLFLYIILEFWKPFKRSFFSLYRSIKDNKTSMKSYNDPFCKMNSHYAEAPEWWFVIVFVVALACGIGAIRGYPTETPVWSLFFALIFSLVVMIPTIQFLAVTGALITLQGLVDIVAGYTLRGHMIAYFLLHLFGTYIPEQCQNYLSNQKVAHYAKVPPRAMFRGQLLSCVINVIITIAIVNWQVGLEGFCNPDPTVAPNKFTCPATRSFFNRGVMWGLVGPKLVFKELYPKMKYSFLIGFLLVFPCIAFKWYGPKKYSRPFQPVMVLNGLLQSPPYNLSYYTPSVYWAIGFMWYLKNKYVAWWSKYNYIFYSGIQAGIAFSSVIIFFSVYYHPKDISWWGNDIVAKGIDGMGGASNLDVSKAKDGFFGPRTWGS